MPLNIISTNTEFSALRRMAVNQSLELLLGQRSLSLCSSEITYSALMSSYCDHFEAEWANRK